MVIKSVARGCLILAVIIQGFGQVSSMPLKVSDKQEKKEREFRQIELPDTTLGRIMREWFAVIESGKEEEIKSFVNGRFSANAFRFQQSAEQYVAFFRKLHEQSGGLEILQVTPETGVQPISIIAKSKRGEHFALIRAGLDNAEKGKLAGLGVDKTQSPDAPKLSAISTPLSEREMITAIKKDLDRRAAAGDLSGVVLIAKDDRILLEQAYGFADREAKIPNTTDTGFHLASVGKMFTAVAVARLVKEGKLSYTDTIAKVLPDYPNKEVAERVTIHHLLTHTAGFGTFFESPGFVKGKTYRNSTEEIAVYKDEKLFFEPGTRWRYSNAGYSLLGAIIERISGKPYLQYIRENIFKPLGMGQTYTDSFGIIASKTSVLYRQSPQDPLGLDPYLADKTLSRSQATGFGGGFSTAPDMFKFLRAYRTGKLLGAETIQKMVNGKVNQDNKGARRYAYGITEFDSNGELVRGHSGGSRTDVEMLWNGGYTVIVLVNAVPPPVDAISNDIINFATKQKREDADYPVRAPDDCKPGCFR
ncbi:MAG TPA: serine hydrolase domain-containing protein [Pyrinomonadaceae bacterium]